MQHQDVECHGSEEVEFLNGRDVKITKVQRPVKGGGGREDLGTCRCPCGCMKPPMTPKTA